MSVSRCERAGEVEWSGVKWRKGVEYARAARFRTAIANNLYEAASCERDSVSYGTQVKNFGESTFISVLKCPRVKFGTRDTPDG